MRKFIPLACALVLLVHGACAAQTAAKPGDNFTILGVGTESCGAWRADRVDPNGPESMADMAWIGGYITGFNRYTGGTEHNISGETDMQGILAGMDDYCRGHPLDSVETAAEILIDDLLMRKIQREWAPK